MRSDADIVGCSTRIGIGEVAWSTAQVAEAPVVIFVRPFSIPANQVEILLVTLTRISAAAATPVGARLRLLRPTLAAVGKSIYTLFPNVPEFAALRVMELPNPFIAA
jgi:hypothetical protein